MATQISSATLNMKPGLNLRIKFVKQDCWVGLYWSDRYFPALNLDHECIDLVGKLNLDHECIDLVGKRTWFLCIIPCFPIIWTTHTHYKI